MQDPLQEPRLAAIIGDDGLVDRSTVAALLSRHPRTLTIPEIEAMQAVFSEIQFREDNPLADVTYTAEWLAAFVAVTGGTITRETVRHGETVQRSTRRYKGRDDVQGFRRSHTNGTTRRVVGRAREYRRTATRRGSSSSRTSSADPGDDGSDEPPAALGYCECCVPARPIRLCACGCRRDITHKRADAKTFGASCRQRIRRTTEHGACHPLPPRTCQCESGFFYRDADGDAVCGLCGCWIAKGYTSVSPFTLVCEALLRDNGVYVKRQYPPRPWPDTQHDYRARKAVAA